MLAKDMLFQIKGPARIKGKTQELKSYYFITCIYA